MPNSEWFSWNDGNVRRSVRIADVQAIECREGDVSRVLVPGCGGSWIVIGSDDAKKLKDILGVE